MVDLSIVIPCYNSSDSIHELAEKLNSVLENMNITYEVIFINDCSIDDSLSSIKNVVYLYNSMVVIDLMFNVGQFRALYCGLEASNGKYIITMDDDLQHSPEEIPNFYRAIENDDELDAIFGKVLEKKHSIVRKVGSFFVKKINEIIFKKPKSLHMSSFRILRRVLVETMLSHNTMYPVFGPMILKSTRRIINIDIDHKPRKYKKSNYNLLLLLRTTLDNIINFSSLPLKCISLIGFFSAFIGFLIGVIYLIRYMVFGNTIEGWTSLAVLLNIYGGLILLSIGVIGEYLIRVLFEVQGSPKYKIRQIYKS